MLGLGVDVDQSFKGDYIITSALKPLESSVYDVIRQFVEGEFQGGANFFFSVQDFPDGALLVRPLTHPAIPEGVEEAVEAAKQQLISGEIDPTASVEEVGVTE